MADPVTLRDDYPPGTTVKIDGRGQAVVQRKKTSTILIVGFGTDPLRKYVGSVRSIRGEAIAESPY